MSRTIVGFLFLAVGDTTMELLACVFTAAGALAIAVLAGLRRAQGVSAAA